MRRLLPVFAALALILGAEATSASAAKSHAEHHPAFKWRGVIQGSYGPPWTAGQRMRMLQFMSKHGFNAYINAPKDDVFQRDRWREPYPADEIAELQNEVRVAASLGIQWVPNISPAPPQFPSQSNPDGISSSPPICYSCPEDLQVLLGKYEPFIEAGAKTFMLSIDDVNQQFTWQADLDTYGTGPQAYGNANADLMNRLEEALRARVPGAHLLTVGADYLGSEDRGYLQGLRSKLLPGIDVMWTGPEIQSRQFRPSDADTYRKLLGRKTIIYENWTANDQVPADKGIPDRIYLGPYRRIPQLKGHLKGFFLNASLESDANFLPFITAARYLDSPFTYRPRRAFLDATKDLAGKRSESLRAFAEVNYSDTLAPSEEAPTFVHLSNAVLHAYRAIPHLSRKESRNPKRRRALARAEGRFSEASAALAHELRLVVHAKSVLRKVHGMGPFVHQTAVFLTSGRLAARMGLAATSLLDTVPGSPAQRHRRRALNAASKRSFDDPYETYGSRLRYFYLVGNVMDRYVDQVRKIDRARTRVGG